MQDQPAALQGRAATPTRPRSTATTRRTTLNKLISTKFADSGSPAVDLIKNFKWTNDDQNLVSTYIAQDGMYARRRGQEVDRRQPRQGRRLAAADRAAT